MYAAVKQKKPKVIGREAAKFINKTALIVTGVCGFVFAALYALSDRKVDPSIILSYEQRRKFLRYISDPPIMDIYMSGDLLARHREHRNITEKVYEAYQASHGKEQKK